MVLCCNPWRLGTSLLDMRMFTICFNSPNLRNGLNLGSCCARYTGLLVTMGTQIFYMNSAKVGTRACLMGAGRNCWHGLANLCLPILALCQCLLEVIMKLTPATRNTYILNLESSSIGQALCVSMMERRAPVALRTLLLPRQSSWVSSPTTCTVMGCQ